jgi:predicted ABC-type ATPase
MIAGPNGSGKSTLIAELLKRRIYLGEYLNADDIALTLSGDIQTVSAQAQAIVRERRLTALEQGRDYCFETVMSHISHIEHFAHARERGFETRLYFIATEDPIINLSRVENRVFHGGHAVPPDRVSARYFRSLGNLPAAIDAADYCLILDNSSALKPLLPLAEIKAGNVRQLLDPSIDDLPLWWSRIVPLLRRGLEKRQRPL